MYIDRVDLLWEPNTLLDYITVTHLVTLSLVGRSIPTSAVCALLKLAKGLRS